MKTPRICLGPTLVGLFIAASTGCRKTDQIERYSVRKPPPIESPRGSAGDVQPVGEPKDRTLAAIVPKGEQGWFFKLTGPKDAVAAQTEAFTNFLKTVRFSADGKPQWTLPAGWEGRPGSDIRYATLAIPAEGGPLEVSVTALPKPPGDDENYALVNVNRWRNQLRLPPIAREQLAEQSTTLELDGTTATMVDLVGHASPNAMGRPPLFPGAGDGK
jgi:hypothetical protein